MDATIFLFLLQDGIINGAVYALVAIATVLVFAVTRVILVPQGEFVAFTALTIAALENGQYAVDAVAAAGARMSRGGFRTDTAFS